MQAIACVCGCSNLLLGKLNLQMQGPKEVTAVTTTDNSNSCKSYGNINCHIIETLQSLSAKINVSLKLFTLG